MDKISQPLTKLSEFQSKVYEAVKHLKAASTKEISEYLTEPSKRVATALRSLRTKELVVYQQPVYKITNKKSFEIKRKKTNEELPPNYHQIKDQLEWNQKILQQKALRELRMRINL